MAGTENATYISDLDDAKPAGGDSASYGADHLRLNLAVVTAVAFLLWPRWRMSVVIVFFVLGALAQVLAAAPLRTKLPGRGRYGWGAMEFMRTFWFVLLCGGLSSNVAG